MVLSWLWAVFTVCASAAQIVRNAMQRELTGPVGTIGATYVRFMFGLPFALLFLATVMVVTGDGLPHPAPGFWLWLPLGAGSQIMATGLMLSAMKRSSFVVSTAYMKTEPVQVAIFGFVLLGERLNMVMALGIAIATAGVLMMIRPGVGMKAAGARAAFYGLGSGALFGLSSVGYRGTVQALPHDHFVMASTFSLVVSLSIQCVVFTAWLLWRDRSVLQAVLRSWRPSLTAGFFGALASQFWMLSLSLAPAASVRTLALIEVAFAQGVSRVVFKQRVAPREALGIAMIVMGCVLLFWRR